jgi:hypothetical protein
MHTVIIRDLATPAIEWLHRNNIPIKRITPPGASNDFSVQEVSEIAMRDGFVDLTINYHTVFLRTVEYSSIEIF